MFMGMGMEKFCGGIFFFFFFVLEMDFFFFWNMEKILLDIGEFWTWKIFGHRKFLLDMEFWSWKIFAWHEIFGWTNFWTWKIFVGHEILDMENFVGHVDDWPTLFCRTSRVEVASRCWKTYGKYCLWILGTSFVKLASRLFSRPYWIMILMRTRIFNYSLLCQSGFGILLALSIFYVLVKWCWYLMISQPLLA